MLRMKTVHEVRQPGRRRRSPLPRALPWGELRRALWVPAYMACFAMMEFLPPRTYWATQLPIDDWIPFCSWFLIPYASWYFLLLGTGLYLLARNVPAYRRYMLFLSTTFFTAVLLWTFFPNGQDLRPASPEGFLGPAMAFIYRIDTNTNVFPSIHVVGAVGAALAVRDGVRNRAARWGVYAQTVLICLSTVFVKQHSVLDVAGGLAFSAAAWVLVYARPAWLRRLWRRSSCDHPRREKRRKDGQSPLQGDL